MTEELYRKVSAACGSDKNLQRASKLPEKTVQSSYTHEMLIQNGKCIIKSIFY